MARRFLSPIHKAIRQISLYFEENGRESGLTPQESHMLAYLCVYQPAAVSELHRVFGTKRSTLTSQLDRLEKRGLITRNTAPEDRRSFLIALTAEGDATAKRIQKHTASLERRIGNRLSASDIEGFNAVMEAVSHATRIAVRSKGKE
jgi:DNA-binding MarR family transcriptional regulator